MTDISTPSYVSHIDPAACKYQVQVKAGVTECMTRKEYEGYRPPKNPIPEWIAGACIATTIIFLVVALYAHRMIGRNHDGM